MSEESKTVWTYRDLSFNNTIIAKDLSLIADWRRSFDGNVGGGISSIHRFPIELKNINSTFFQLKDTPPMMLRGYRELSGGRRGRG